MRGILFSALLSALVGSLLLGGLREAVAAPVRGKVTLPKAEASGRRFRGYWRIENGIVPTASASRAGDTVVVLTDVKGPVQPARTVTVDIQGLRAAPSTVVVGPGSVVEFKNSDGMAHDLSIPEKPDLMPVQRLAPGALRRQRFANPGGFAVKDAEYPHIVVSVLVVASAHFAQVDEKGTFRIPDAPAGKATLKVWSHGRFVHEQPIDVGASEDLSITVTEAAPIAAEDAPAESTDD